MPGERYDHHVVEKKWQERWYASGAFAAVERSGASKAYILDMFPYPSGEGLHVGHPEGYTASDIFSRYLRMTGKTVLHPMGWDAFGLPAENYAIKTGTHPAITTKKNIETFKRQIQSLGFSYDWSREVNTTDPSYYKWTQWIFLKLFEHGLAYEAEAPINWCPKDKTGLANEEVVGGKCERCGTTVEKKNIRQWLVKITDAKYVERLLHDLDKLDWPESIKQSQRNWIGKSEGATIKFEIRNSKNETSAKGEIRNSKHEVEVFTTRPDTLFGATYMVLSPEHELVAKITTDEQRKEVEKYQKLASQKSDLDRTDLAKEKTGVFTGAYAINPVNNERIPIWIADYVLASYGTGAIMAVPAHDERDYAFAKKYELPIREVVIPYRYYKPNPPRAGKKTVTRQNVHAIVRHPKTGKILGLKWKNHPWTTFPMGGIDNGEDVVEAAKRELREETGYTHVKVERVLGGPVKSEYFAAHKDENRISYTRAVCFVLTSEEHEALVDEENAKHEVVWLDSKDVVPEKMTHAELDVWIDRMHGKGVFTGEGEMIDSGSFTGKQSADGRNEIVAWLAREGKGKAATNYKLRDWVFSRQRYWGEPIPVVHCEKCKERKLQVIIIHGTGSNGNANWYPWVAERLRSRGHEVHTPDMPDSLKPELQRWLAALEKIPLQGKNTVIIGHSLGAVAAMHLVARLQKKVSKLILVSPTHKDMDWGEFQRLHPKDPVQYQEKFSRVALDFDAVHANVKEISFYHSDNDVYIPNAFFAAYRKTLHATFHLLPGRNHFSVSNGSAHEFPELLAEVLQHASGIVSVPEDQLPVVLPDVKKYEPTGTGESPLAGIKDWVNTTCPKCGGPAKRETNTMPQWAGSNWYFLRYCDPHNDKQLADPEKLKAWLPVDTYIGGAEHAVLHLLYARFIYKFLYDIGAVPEVVGDEPFKKLINQGLILAEDGQKMSKSRGNVINPDLVVREYGADALRMFEMFMGPLEDVKPWNTRGIVGVRRFLDKVWGLQEKAKDGDDLHRDTHALVKQIGEDIASFSLNTAVSNFMKWTNTAATWDVISKSELGTFFVLLSPFAPHIAQELWSKLGHTDQVHDQQWPTYDPEMIMAETVDVVVQVNGKVRDTFTAAAGAADAELQSQALASEKIKKWLDGKTPKKIIVVKGKLVSIVV